MKHFFMRLLPPRPTFPGDMTPAEGQLMKAHAEYWAQQLAQGVAVVYGPVMDPKGPFGLAVFQAADEGAAQALIARDPVVAAKAGFQTELHLMARALYRAPAA